ncbi:MAG: tripartite tricarboxylate transporter substrate binding protein [Pigmentiphaga sp.]|uniref:Bug family tripartite tricarboxylate transporter substrate binding protein n=1 Tax=Pigmentiphaga sp. TaxID=1977564 RepID=UPI0029A11148|nr:tripartite tricarboxylate transporter substrate binding protein [Pigmentiphaga sp.]MDX3905912.1 tripartite tricarboxylate transporter substrate binding protein [Pigmentiphaga sp.]
MKRLVYGIARIRGLIAAVLVFTGLAFVVPAGAAEQYPNRNLELIVPYAPGGLLDVAARLSATYLAQELGQPVVVRNVPGAGGTIGMVRLAKAKPDGYTLALGSFGLLINKKLRPDVEYDPLRSFTPVGYVGDQGFVLMVAPAHFDVANVNELAERIKAKPGAYTYASGGVGAPSHVLAEQFRAQQGLNMVHAPYQGQNPAIMALLAGDVQVTLQTVAGAEELLHSGRIRGLASTGSERPAAFPTVPTFKELGIEGMENEGWLAIFAPSGVSQPVKEKLRAAWARVASNDEFRQALAKRAIQARAVTPEQFETMMADDLKYWTQLLDKTGITLN